MTDRELLHKWFGGQTGELTSWLKDYGLSEGQAREFLVAAAEIAERRRGQYQSFEPLQVNPKAHTVINKEVM